MRVRSTISVVVLLAAAACSGSSDEHGDAENVPLSDVPRLYAEAICEAYGNCLGDALTLFLSGVDCVDRTEPRIAEAIPRFEQSIDEGKLVYRGDALEACLAELRGRSCEGLLERDSEACLDALDGTVALGGECDFDEECAGQAFCGGGTCPGACTALATAGETCREDDHCASGLVCSGDTGRCVAPGSEGDVCDAGEPECAPGFACAGADADVGTPGACEPYESFLAGALGDECSLEGLCQAELVCVISVGLEGITGTCSEPVAADAECSVAFPDPCPSHQYCAVSGVSLNGNCTPLPAPGEACATAPLELVGSLCAPGDNCDDGICRAPASLGSGCTEDATCLSERCFEGACVAGSACEVVP
jgi:hypothetical protein